MKTLKTQRDYMKELNSSFHSIIGAYREVFDSYSYRDDRATNHIAAFKRRVELLGLKFSNCYHANGIGNNNEYKIFLETIDDDGFLIQKNIAELYYCYGIYGGCSVMLTDLVTGERLKVSSAR